MARNAHHLGLVAWTAAALGLPQLPGWWLGQAACIHRHECAGDWHYGPSRYTRCGDPHKWSGYYGGLQFTLGTWHRADVLLHRHDDPQWSSPGIQLAHAYAIWQRDGGSWREWSTAGVCGLR